MVPDSRNLPDRVHRGRFPFLVERLGLAVDSGGAGPAPRRAGLREAHPDAARRALHVDRGPLDPGLLGGQGRPGRAAVQVTIDPGGPNERVVDALADAEPVRAGEVIRIRTTGGGGWGDPLDRPYADGRCATCVGQGVARPGRARDYGVVLTGTADEPVVDEAASDALRARCAGGADRRREPFFDRGPGYARLSGGAPAADVDFR